MIKRMQALYPWLTEFFGTRRMALLAVFAMVAFGAELIALPMPAAHASCQYLGTNYPVQYDCTQNQPWLPYGTYDNPPNTGRNPTVSCLPPYQHNQGC